MEKKRKYLTSIKQKREKTIKYLKYQKVSYDKKLSRIFSEQRAIQKTLNELNILKKKMVDNRKKEVLKSNINNQTVRQIGTSYQASRMVKYRGPKTIAPLRSFYIKRKFGTYFDPIYKIKIFNESVILGSKIPNAKVRNVLNGKVVFAKSTPMLDNVVIVENSNGIHTIYAHLSKIAPTIKKGKRIKKGYIIGRIKDELTFEVTQKNKHINPLRLIRF
ncbi:MAG: M23 family metallopeptidase [Epsilonproteobacteria bacterium]|nr:M23 family metallopeptidase [Campylobacterota bacterium]